MIKQIKFSFKVPLCHVEYLHVPCIKAHVQFVHYMVMRKYMLCAMKITSWMITSALSDAECLSFGEEFGFCLAYYRICFLKNQRVIAIVISM